MTKQRQCTDIQKYTCTQKEREIEIIHGKDRTDEINNERTNQRQKTINKLRPKETKKDKRNK